MEKKEKENSGGYQLATRRSLVAQRQEGGEKNKKEGEGDKGTPAGMQTRNREPAFYDTSEVEVSVPHGNEKEGRRRKKEEGGGEIPFS